MEPQICEELFTKENYSVMIGEVDSSCEAHIRQNVNPDKQKWSDKNHVLRTLGKLSTRASILTLVLVVTD